MECQTSKESRDKAITPYVVVIGDLFNREDRKVIVVLHTRQYIITSNRILDAVDICYKVFVILGLSFPSETKHLWAFFEKYIYESKVNSLRSYKSVRLFAEELFKIMRR